MAIIEYKAPHVAVSQKVFDQIVRYNMVLRVPWLFVSNGLSHYCCRVDYEGGRSGLIRWGVDYSPGMIASLGQTSAQVPHSMQVSGSIT